VLSHITVLPNTPTLESQYVTVPSNTEKLYSNQEYKMHAIVNVTLHGVAYEVKIHFPNFTTQKSNDIIPLGKVDDYIALDDTLVLKNITLVSQSDHNTNMDFLYKGNIKCYSLQDNISTYTFTNITPLENIIKNDVPWIINIQNPVTNNQFRFVCDDIEFKSVSDEYVPLHTNKIQYEFSFKDENGSEMFELDSRNISENTVVTHNYLSMYNYYKSGENILTNMVGTKYGFEIIT
jgi:hypothetical protein